MHEQYPEHDRVITEWFLAQGWPVSMRHYDFDGDMLAWQSGATKPPMTLRVALEVIEDTPPQVLGAALDSLGLAAKLQADPAKYTLLRRTQSSFGIVQLEAAP